MLVIRASITLSAAEPAFKASSVHQEPSDQAAPGY
jgi:hypothetical protein